MVVDYRRGNLPGVIGPGILDNNPVHRAMIEACAMAPPVFILNSVTDPDGNITAAAAGELVQAHVEACRCHDLYYQRELEDLAIQEQRKLEEARIWFERQLKGITVDENHVGRNIAIEFYNP